MKARKVGMLQVATGWVWSGNSKNPWVIAWLGKDLPNNRGSWVIRVIVPIRGQAPDSEGGSDLDKIFRGEDFFGFLLGGIDFLTSKGGYPLHSFTRFSKLF